jgi:hypothetical protein
VDCLHPHLSKSKWDLDEAHLSVAEQRLAYRKQARVSDRAFSDRLEASKSSACVGRSELRELERQILCIAHGVIPARFTALTTTKPTLASMLSAQVVAIAIASGLRVVRRAGKLALCTFLGLALFRRAQ